MRIKAVMILWCIRNPCICAAPGRRYVRLGRRIASSVFSINDSKEIFLYGSAWIACIPALRIGNTLPILKHRVLWEQLTTLRHVVINLTPARTLALKFRQGPELCLVSSFNGIAQPFVLSLNVFATLLYTFLVCERHLNGELNLLARPSDFHPFMLVIGDLQI